MEREKMTATFSSPKQYNVRSVSFPSRSHPNTNKIEEELNKLTSLDLSSSSIPAPETIFAALSGLTNLYKHVSDLFNLPANQQALAHHPQHKTLMVSELLDGSVTFLDICGKTRDILLLIKQSARELQSALRRKKGGDWSIDCYIGAYVSSRKKTKKEITKSLASLKQMENITPLILDLNDHLSAIVKVVREASLVTRSIFRSLLLFLSVPASKPKSATRWSLILKLVSKRVGAGNETHQPEVVIKKNELESVGVEIRKLLMAKDVSEEDDDDDDEAEKIRSTLLTRLEGVDIMIEDFEKRVEWLFRRTIEARVSLLNSLST
ncbi:uncharacterized protein LOC110822522 [Carica papaya]|uniref:uncharacterized protein LOC110822522 n=1 Tax=Carica papaya TaxID=3649 RepID=UPI000B8CDC77|nr:uncharacterized protein LOC110822522 [Carica papaya]